MNAQQLQLADGTKVPAWQCGECGLVYPEKKADSSDSCCKCRDCGANTRRPGSGQHHLCEACWGPHYEKRDAVIMDKATLVADYVGPVCHGDKFWSDLGEMCDELHGDGKPLPDFVYACLVTAYSLDAETILQDLLENGGNPEASESDLDGCKELADAIDVFNKANEGNHVWECDQTRKVAVPKLESLA